MSEHDERLNFILRPESASPAVVDGFWHDLATATGCSDAMPNGRDLATCVNERERLDLILPAVIKSLDGMVRAAAENPTASAQAITRLSELVLHLKAAVLVGALRAEASQVRREAFLGAAVRVLSTHATLRLAPAAAAAYGKPLSPPMRDLLKKLANAAVSLAVPARASAQALFRSIVRANLLSTTEAKAPVSWRDVPVQRGQDRVTAEAERVLQVALEADTAGPAVTAATDELVAAGRVGDVLGMLKELPRDYSSVAFVTTRIASNDLLQSLLREDPVDLEAVELVINALGTAAARVLLEELTESRSRRTRRAVLDHIVALGPDVAALAERRLREDRRWFVQRNMLLVLRSTNCKLPENVIERFVSHQEARVRREALLIMVAEPASRTRGLCRGLADTDRNVVRVMLQEARASFPDAAVPVLSKGLTEGELLPEFRVPALQLLSGSKSVLALNALLHFAQAGTNLIGRPKLAPRSAEMIAALEGLARSWPAEARARRLVEAARTSRDASVRAAVADPAGAR